MRPLVLLLLLTVVAGCREAEPGPPAATTVRAAAPTVIVHTDEGPVHLSSLHGSTVVLQFANAADADAWAALADAVGDLEASGAIVLAVEADGPGAVEAEAFGYDGHPLTVVVDGEGTIRGRTEPTSGDAVFELAAPVLAEADLAQTVAWPGAETIEALVSAGGVIVDLGAEAGAFPNALRLLPEDPTLDALPADLGTPLAFVGATAEDVARQAVERGYAAVFVAAPDGVLTEIMPERPPAGAWQPSGGVRG